MDERPKWTTEQLETLETFRAGEDDPTSDVDKTLKNEPELARRLERILEWDSRLSQAMREVPVPAGLAEQILQSLNTSTAPTPEAPQPRHHRRFWITITAAVGIAACLMVAILFRGLPAIDGNRLRSVALERFEANRGADPSGSPYAEGEVVEDFPYSSDLISRPGTRWRRVDDFGRAETAVYDIPLGRGQKATFYVVRCRSSALPLSPPTIPDVPTRGLAVAAWQGDGVVYVLVVDERAYGYLVRPRRLM